MKSYLPSLLTLCLVSCGDKEDATLHSALEKVEAGQASTLTPSEADALRGNRETRQARYKVMFDQKVEAKLAHFPKQEVEAYWIMRRAMDAYAETHDDFSLEKQNSMFADFAQQLGKPVTELQALYLKIDAKTALTSAEVDEIKSALD